MQRKFKKTNIVPIVLLLNGLVYAGDAPSMEWHKGYGTSYGSHVHEGMQTSDGGYIGIGQTWSQEDYPEMLIIKIDSNGNKEWRTIVGISDKHDVGICIAEVSDGFICGGGLYDSGNQKPALVKLDKNSGDIITGWPKYYSGTNNCCIRGIDILEDGSIVATGYTDSQEGYGGFVFICDDGDGFIMKTDSNGNLEWNKSLSVPQGTKVRQISGGFAVASCAWYYDGGDHMDAVLIKTDGNGLETDKYHYGDTNNEHCYDFDLTSDGGYILGGHTTSYGVANWDYYLLKIDSDGNEEWHKTFGNPRGYDARYIHDEAYGVRQTPDGGYVIAGGSGDEYGSYSSCTHPFGCSDEWKAYIVKTDNNGDPEWEGIYPEEKDIGNTACEFIGLTSDGGYILFNDTDAFWDEVGSNAFGFMKIAGSTKIKSDNTSIPSNMQLHQNYPNPFNPTTQIQFDLNKSGFVTIDIFSILGVKVMTLLNENVEAGYHQITFDGSELSSGSYIYRIKIGDFMQMKKCLLVK